MLLYGKTAIVSGASAGLGLAVSEALIQKGARVFGFARRTIRLREAEDRFTDRFVGIACDVSDPDSVARALEQVRIGSDRIDVLVNNAACGRFGDVEGLSREDWEIQMRTNLRGVFLLTREVIPVLRRQNERTGFGGHIVNISSVAGLVGKPEATAYNATKFGLRGFSEALMKEVRNDGIKVTCLYPGTLETEFFEASGSRRTSPALAPEMVASTVIHVLDSKDNYLVSEVAMWALRDAEPST